METVPRPALLVAALALLAVPAPASCGAQEPVRSDEVIALPAPRTDEGLAVERAIAGRRSAREFGPGAVTLGELGQLLWAAQGISDPEPEAPPGFRYGTVMVVAFRDDAVKAALRLPDEEDVVAIMPVGRPEP